ncbi:plasma-membrane choline transporter-domain-containing protein [Helicostylum pulchrum]|nr:plasma-membrane choline transporter-domain-containing protein [Helicostylum pulchrum]
MEQSIPNFAKEAFQNLKTSLFQGASNRRYYAQMDQESENEEEENMSHSLFYSVHQQKHNINEDSIPLTLSNAYSDRSQLLFEQSEHEDYDQHDISFHHSQESPTPPKPSAIYLDPEENTGFQFTNPLSESLLPTSASIPPGITNVDRKYRDPLFAILYMLSIAVFFLSGIIILFTTNSRSIEDYVKGSTFKTIKDSAGILSIIIATALIMGSVWMYILRTFTKSFVWGTVICIPITLTGIFIWTLVESLQNNFVYDGIERTATDTGLTVLSFVPLIVNLVYIKVVYDGRHRINKTIAVIELACDVIRCNPGIILVSLILLVVFISFSIVWIIFFNRLWLIGHLGDASSLSGAIWIVNNYVYSLAAFYVLIYMWTAKLLIYMERFALSSITAQWYFHRNEASPTFVPWKNALTRACTNSLGTIAFGSLILAVIQFLSFSARSLRKYTKVPRPFSTLLTIILGYIDAMISTFNNYTISLAGITGENFFSAAKSATKIFRRNLLTGLFGDLLTQLILYIGASVIALSSGFGAYIYATHNLHSPHGFVVGLIATLMPWYLSQFFSYTMMSIIDASFLCYAIDLDTGTVHLSAAHTAFSGFD